MARDLWNKKCDRHGYVKVKNEIIWEIVKKEVPLLKQEIGAKAGLL